MKSKYMAVSLLVIMPGAAHGQALRIDTGAAPGIVAATQSRGYTAYPASALTSFGAKLFAQTSSLRVVLFDDTMYFDARSPFFRVNSRLQQLVNPVYRESGEYFLPEQFFIEWLPRHFDTRIAFSGGALKLRDRSIVVRDPQPEIAPTSATKTRDSTFARIVILDAGHGGRDPGKIGPNGVREKDVALQLTQRLAGLLRGRGYEVHLTRGTDTLIALADRPRLANQWKAGRPACLYVSMHANAGDRTARGFETYFLSDARTDDERRVAEMENAATAYEEHVAAGAPEMDQILNNLRNNYYIKASDDLAETVQHRLAMFHPGPNRGVKQAGFRVLVGAFMPAVLVESAFISHRTEANLLATSAFQQKIALGVAEAIENFFDTHEHLWAGDSLR